MKHYIEANRLGRPVPTPDFGVRGIGKVDVYAPSPTASVNNITRQIAKKSKRQARRVLLQVGDRSNASVLEIIGKTFGKRDARRLREIFVQTGDGIIRFTSLPDQRCVQ